MRVSKFDRRICRFLLDGTHFAALALTWMFWGAPAAYAPLPEALAAGVVVWVVLLAVRWAQVRGAVHSSPAACLRS